MLCKRFMIRLQRPIRNWCQEPLDNQATVCTVWSVAEHRVQVAVSSITSRTYPTRSNLRNSVCQPGGPRSRELLSYSITCFQMRPSLEFPSSLPRLHKSVRSRAADHPFFQAASERSWWRRPFDTLHPILHRHFLRLPTSVRFRSPDSAFGLPRNLARSSTTGP